MKPMISLLAFGALAACSAAGPIMRPIHEDLHSARADGFLNPSIELSFGKSEITGKNLGTWVSNKKTNSSNKTAEEACQIAFLSAVKSLQDRAVHEGGNAVTNIHSFYDKVPEWSTTEYRCKDGHLMSGVALRGTVVKK